MHVVHNTANMKCNLLTLIIKRWDAISFIIILFCWDSVVESYSSRTISIFLFPHVTAAEVLSFSSLCNCNIQSNYFRNTSFWNSFWNFTSWLYNLLIMPSFTVPPSVSAYLHVQPLPEYVFKLHILNDNSSSWSMYSLLLDLYNLYTFPHNGSKTVLVKIQSGSRLFRVIRLEC